MPSLKSLKLRIASVKSTQKITKAMKMVAAAKLRRAQEAAEAARPYAERMEAVIAGLAARVAASPTAPRLLAGTGADRVHCLIVATSDRGLCGAFNANIIRAARRRLEALEAEGRTVCLYLVGRKARTAFQRVHGGKILHVVDLGHVKTVGFADAAAIAADLVRRYEAGAFDVASLFYARFRSALVQEPVMQQLMPVALSGGAGPDGPAAEVTYEPGEEEILDALLPRNVAVQVFRALLENAASEQGARMTAMDNATRNAGDMINRLTLTYNRTRQAAITKELIEIISGAEAL